jgi:SAM-dependent methyltransferase
MARLRLHLEDSRRGARDPLLPPRRKNLPSQAPAVGEQLVNDMRHHCDLTPSSDVLDMGCGPGRVAAPLTRFLQPAHGGSYEGFDVMPKSIKWCQKAITPKYPSFRFQLADLHNAQYNPKGSQRADSYVFPYDDESFDVALAASLFTHLQPFEGQRYIEEAYRVLRPGGRLFSTWFLLNDNAKEMLRTSRSHASRDAVKLDHEYTDEQGNRFRSAFAEAPEHMIAIDEQLVRDQHERAGLEVTEVRYGSWPAGPGGKWPGQDMIISRRPAE